MEPVVQEERSVVPLEQARAAIRVPRVVRPAEVSEPQAPPEMARQALQGKLEQAAHPVAAAGGERVE